MILAASLSDGSWFGAKLAHAVPRTALRVIVDSWAPRALPVFD